MGHSDFWRGGGDGPVSPVTWPSRKTVLALVHNYQAGDRLSEFMQVVEADPRVQVVYTQPPGSMFEKSGAEYLRRLDGTVLPWEEAVRFRFDAGVAANHGHLEQVRAPVLVLPHGTGFSRMPARGYGYGPPAERAVGGAVRGALVRYGRVVPAAIGVASGWQRSTLLAAVPEAATVAHVVGDPCYDRARASLPQRERYRRAAGVGAGERLVVVASTWGTHGLLGAHRDLPERLASELPPGHVAAALLHPGVWWAHGPRQVRAWLAPARRRGLRLLAPTSPWMGLLVAADVVIGDQTSGVSYAAGLGTPVLLADGGPAEVAPGSQVEALHRYALHYDPEVPPGPQVEAAVARHDPGWAAAFDSLVTSAPGRSVSLIRSHLYRLMDLPEPATAAEAEPLRLPRFVGEDGEERAWAA
ncbi:hypothetical protein OUQ99_28860 [Streptomonospora nanhaiensis]|uniref:Uncharacterized protein n=1 Tax=Streptomonospora nanhaiensis TaxID=1323731 RepID=A0ABY6YM67_9ACTN|nr:hypothetical protein [Streptomonospora nanhaiensis]WAE73121.1 hypothetical protein OUQ99_28860 [Streptomonospora nanhaiensis]